MSDGRRLAAWRDSLPVSPQGHGMTRNGLSRAVGWSDTQWRRLEESARWNPAQRKRVRDGVTKVAGWLAVSPETVDACVAHVLDGAPAPHLGPWREGECPA